jgi:NAD(P)-dependent dehydrogenase (short-subunit alcohol dehydrogenase family)
MRYEARLARAVAGRTVLVTGASSGIGRALAHQLAEAGARLILVARDAARLERTLEEVRGRGAAGLALRADLADRADVRRLVAELGAEAVDVLVNNAGLSPLAPSSDETSEELFDKVVAVNFKGPFRLSAIIARRMKAAGRGSVINVSSTGALRPQPHFGPYAGSKAALNAITTALAQEYAPEVRFNVISPGGFYTDISKGWADPEGPPPDVLLQRYGYPREIVTAALYFASDASSYTTGSLLRVDGLGQV